MKRSHGPRRGTRRSLRRPRSQRGKTPISVFLQEFKTGEIVLIKPDPSVQKGMPHRRFFNKHAIVRGKRGSAYILEVKDKDAKKEVICSPAHLRVVR